MIHQFTIRVTPIINRQFYIRTALILVVIAVGWTMSRIPDEARHTTVRRLATLAFAAFAIFNIAFPRVMSSVVYRIGAGRGAGSLLYALIIAFLAQTLPSFRRNSVRERQITHLVRRIALGNAPELLTGAWLTAKTDD